MNRFLLTLLLYTLVNLCGFSQNVEFEKNNFPGREDAFREAGRNLQSGISLYNQGLYREAIAYLEKANSFNPSNAVLNFYLGNAFLYSDDPEMALTYYKASLALDPEQFTNILFVTARALHACSRFSEAIDYYSRYLAILPDKGADLVKMQTEREIKRCEYGLILLENPRPVIVRNAGNLINTEYPEYSPVIDPLSVEMLYTSRRPNTSGGRRDMQDDFYCEDIYGAEYINFVWHGTGNQTFPYNYSRHNATAGLSKDGNTLFIYVGTENGNIYSSTIGPNGWSVPKALPEGINSSFHESSVSLTTDGNTLYFVSDRPGGYGGKDIYCCQKSNIGWSQPANLGQAVNTPEDEEGVFIDFDDKTLYFSSEGHSGMGGFDVFKSERQPDGSWQNAINLGIPVNGPGNDVFFSLTADGKTALFSSARPGGFGAEDIYVIELAVRDGGDPWPMIADTTIAAKTQDILVSTIELVAPENRTDTVKVISVGIEPVVQDSIITPGINEAEPKTGNKVRKTLIAGIVTDKTSKLPLEAEIEVTDNSKKTTILTTRSGKSGRFSVLLDPGGDYGINVNAPFYLFHSENVVIPGGADSSCIKLSIMLQRPVAGSNVVLNNIFFDYNKASLRSESETELNRLLGLLGEYPAMKIEISGHTDSIGSAVYNKSLSERRAAVVAAYLVSKGIKAARIVTFGYGFAKPIGDNRTPEGRQLNRRVEFKILE